jgi:hypothetical protein
MSSAIKLEVKDEQNFSSITIDGEQIQIECGTIIIEQ